MSDEELIGYLLDLLDPAERAAVEAAVGADPDAAARLDSLRLALIPLEADRIADDPPPGLAVRTVGRLAEYLVEHEPREGAGQETPAAALVRALALGDLSQNGPLAEPVASPAP